MRLLHSADWHLGSPLGENRSLREALERIPFRVVQAAKEQGCDVILLAGDLFDGIPTPHSLSLVKRALGQAGMPVFISPGNHDYVTPGGFWLSEAWPENVHIFTEGKPESVALPQLDCRIYGAAFRGPQSDALLEGFCADGQERYCIGLFHGDAATSASPYNPVSRAQIADSALDYLALGHIHKQGSVQSGATLCAWPGCPAGRGFDETGEKGVLLVELAEECRIRFLSLNEAGFYDLEAAVEESPERTVAALLKTVRPEDHCRVTLTGEAEPFDLALLRENFSGFPNLQLRDRTVPPVDLWENAGEDSLEGMLFQKLQQAMEDSDETGRRRTQLAAKLARQLLLGQEVKLP